MTPYQWNIKGENKLMATHANPRAQLNTACIARIFKLTPPNI